MALGSDPTGLQISGEFGGNTRNTGLTDYDMQWMYNHIIGSGTHSRTAFSGYGKPDQISNFSASTRSTSGGGWVDLSFTVGNNNLPTRVRIEYHETDGNPPFTGQSTSVGPTENYQNSGSKSLTFQVSQAGTEYAFRARHFNEFNEVYADHLTSNSSTATTSSGDNGGDDPTNVTNIVLVQEFTGIAYDHTWEYTETGHTSFQVQHQWDNDGWRSGNLANLSSSGNNYEGRFTPDNLSDGNQIQFRIRGDSSEEWAYTNTYSV